MDTLEIVLAALAYGAVAFGVMRYSYPKLKDEPAGVFDGEAVFTSTLCGLFFPLVLAGYIVYYAVLGFAWLITYQNNG